MDKETKELAEFFREGIKNNPPIIVSPEAFRDLCEKIENPPPPNPALILAMDKARRMREGKSE